MLLLFTDLYSIEIPILELGTERTPNHLPAFGNQISPFLI